MRAIAHGGQTLLSRGVHDLAPLADPEAIAPTLGEAIGVRLLPGQTSLDAAVAHLADARALWYATATVTGVSLARSGSPRMCGRARPGWLDARDADGANLAEALEHAAARDGITLAVLVASTVARGRRTPGQSGSRRLHSAPG